MCFPKYNVPSPDDEPLKAEEQPDHTPPPLMTAAAEEEVEDLRFKKKKGAAKGAVKGKGTYTEKYSERGTRGAP